MENRQRKTQEPDPWHGMSLSEVLQTGTRSNPNTFAHQAQPRRTSQNANASNRATNIRGRSNNGMNQSSHANHNHRNIQPVSHSREQNVNYHDNEFEQQDFEQMLLAERPDPSKKKVCREDEPIKVNPHGKYNLNFIDWDNEWERVFDYYSMHNHNYQDAPIDGMDIQTFESLYDQYMAEEIKEQNGVKEDVLKQIPIKTVTKEDPNRMCAICIKIYSKGNKVFFLPCKHHFHIECIKPWFDKNHVCPNCRFDINQNKHS